jgi:hypothetical protein
MPHGNGLKRVYLLPYWVLSIFSTAKSYRTNPVIGSPVRNCRGLHVLRVVLSHACYRLCLWLLLWGIRKQTRQAS